MVDVRQTAVLAQRLLADELPSRWRHSGGVAARAEGLADVVVPRRQIPDVGRVAT